MVTQVHTGELKTSTSDDLLARTSQCLAVGIIDTTQNLVGIAHIHFRDNHERILDSLIEELASVNGQPRNSEIALSGGVDAFVRGYGFIPGRAIADRVIEYLIKIGLEGGITQKDIHTDYVRKLTASPSGRYLQINRLKTT